MPCCFRKASSSAAVRSITILVRIRLRANLVSLVESSAEGRSRLGNSCTLSMIMPSTVCLRASATTAPQSILSGRYSSGTGVP